MLPAAGSTIYRVADAFGLETRKPPDTPKIVARQVADRLREMFDAMPIPASLRDVGVASKDLPDLAKAALDEPMMAYCPREFTIDEIEELLGTCW